MNKTAQKAARFLLDLVFPEICQGCGLEGTYLCLACQTNVLTPPQHCPVCSSASVVGRTHDRCAEKNLPLEGIMVAADYHQKSVRDLIWYLKYHSVKKIGQTLALLLADFLTGQDLLEYFENAIVVPVPLHKRRKRERGYNQAEVIGEELAKRLGFLYLPVLRRTKHTKRQVDLPRADRLLNVTGHFAAATEPKLEGKKLILIDDVTTSGATLFECARELRKQNPAEIWGLVVARN